MSLRVTAAAVAAAGLAIAAYLTVVHYTGGEAACVIAEGCTVVQKSTYAKLAGVPVALLGAVAYAVILASLARDDDATRTFAAGAALVGAAFSGWLTYVEVFRLEAICAWCVASAVCMTVLAALCVVRGAR